MSDPHQQINTDDPVYAAAVEMIDMLGNLIPSIERRFPEDVELLEAYTRLRNRLIGVLRLDDQQLAEGDLGVDDDSSTTALVTMAEEDADSVTMEKDGGETTRLSGQGQVVVAEEAVASPQETRAEYDAWLNRLDENLAMDLEKEEVAGVEHETRR